MIWIIFTGFYVFSGLGVALAFEDDKHKSLLAFFFSIVCWPTLVAFALTIALRAIAEGKPVTTNTRLGWTTPIESVELDGEEE